MDNRDKKEDMPETGSSGGTEEKGKYPQGNEDSGSMLNVSQDETKNNENASDSQVSASNGFLDNAIHEEPENQKEEKAVQNEADSSFAEDAPKDEAGSRENGNAPQVGASNGFSDDAIHEESERQKDEKQVQNGVDDGFAEDAPHIETEGHENTNASQADTDKTQWQNNGFGNGAGQYGQNGTQQNQGPQYRDPRDPYGYYSGQNNYYGQYGQQQYGQNNYNGNGQSGPNNQNGPNGNSYGQYGQNKYNGPYMPYGVQNGGNYYDYGNNKNYGKRPKKSRGQKIYLWVLTILAAGLVGGLITYSALNVPKAQVPPSGPNSSEYNGASSEISRSVPGAVGGVKGNGLTPDFPGISIQSKPTGTKMDATETYKKVIPSVVSVQVNIAGNSSEEAATSEGTGIIASSGGYILTNAHVINYSKGNTVKVTLHNGKTYIAVVAGYDKTSDIAVLKINASNLSPAAFGDVDDMQIGNQVIAIGNPGGISFAGSLTGGYVSALDRTIEAHSDNGMTYIQTDAAINPGNSGGPLVNMYGQVIGINSSKVVAKGYESMGFSIPVSRARAIINNLITKGYVAGRCRLGITAGTVPDVYREYYKYPEGVLIQSVGSDSDLKNKGIAAGDIITKAGGKNITSLDDLYAMLDEHKPGDVISLTVYSTSQANAGKTKTVKIKLLEDKGETQNK